MAKCDHCLKLVGIRCEETGKLSRFSSGPERHYHRRTRMVIRGGYAVEGSPTSIINCPVKNGRETPEEMLARTPFHKL